MLIFLEIIVSFLKVWMTSLRNEIRRLVLKGDLMKHSLLPFLLLVVFLPIGCGKGKERVEAYRFTARETIDTLAEKKGIERYKQYIESVKGSMQMLEYDHFDTAEGGRTKSYYNGKDTVKKEIKYYGEMGRKHLDCYLKNNSPLLIEEQTFLYEKPLGSTEPVMIRDSIVHIFYFNAPLQLIYWLEDDKKVNPLYYEEKEAEWRSYF